MDTVSEETAIANKKLNNSEKTVGFQPKNDLYRENGWDLTIPTVFCCVYA